MADNYMQDSTVYNYYRHWIACFPNLLGHSLDRESFYRFVKACIQYTEGKNIIRELDTSILRDHLYDDLRDKCSADGYEDITSEIIILFERLIQYENTRLLEDL